MAGRTENGHRRSIQLHGCRWHIFELFDVSLTEGTVAPPFVVPDYASELALCQRYFLKLGGTVAADIVVSGYTTAGNDINHTLVWPVEMRAAPTGAIAGTWTTFNGPFAFNGLGARTGVIRVTATATGHTYAYTPNATCFLKMNARL